MGVYDYTSMQAHTCTSKPDFYDNMSKICMSAQVCDDTNYRVPDRHELYL